MEATSLLANWKMFTTEENISMGLEGMVVVDQAKRTENWRGTEF